MGELNHRPTRAGLDPRVGADDWSALLRCESPEDALRHIADRLPDGLAVELCVAGDESLASGGSGPSPQRASRIDVDVPGDPSWRLVVYADDPAVCPPDRLREVGVALSTWRAARAELDRQDRRLEARTRELSLLQDLGRGAAEARTPSRLFRRAAEVLHDGTGAEVVVAACACEGRRSVEAFLARPLAPDRLGRIASEAARVLGWPAGDVPEPRTTALDGYDAAPGQGPGPGEDDITVAPVVRRGRPVAAIAVAMPDPEESWIRLVFGAVNQLSLHLDRILTVREAEQNRFRAILDSMPQAVVLTDPDLNVIRANPAATRLLDGVAPGGNAARLDRVGDLALAPLAERVLAADPGRAVEGEARGATGAVLSVTLSSVRGEEGRREELVVVISDVTERRRLHEQLAQTEKLSSLGQMISGIAHELNNPLAAVLGYAQLVRGAGVDDKLARRLGMIHDEARRCQRIVNNLLSFARRHEPERKPLSLNDVVRSVLGLVGYPLRVAGIDVRSELDPELPAIHGDRHQLQQAVLNLVTNARHALEDGGGGKSLTLRTRSSDRGATVEVCDDGPGIPADHLSRIYDPFFTTKESGRGTGLGLSIVYGIVTAHGGEIRCRSHPGRGTTFEIELPRGTPTDPEPTAQREAVASPPPRSGRILVIDDEEGVSRLICETLTADGHHVVRALSRDDALGRLAEGEFDLVVVDLKVPGVAEQEFQTELSRHRPDASRGVLFVTGDTVSGEPERQAMRSGVGVLHKPFDLDELLDAVRSRL